LSDSMVRLLRDPERYDRLRRQAWEWSRANTFDRSYDDFLKVVSDAATSAPNLESDLSPN